MDGGHYLPLTSSPPSTTRDDSDEPDAKRVRTTFPPGKKLSVVILKFLVTNHEAGSIIGSSGRTIRDVHEKSGAVIKLSTAREMFPGTEKRVTMLTGSRSEVAHAMDMLLDKMSSDAANWHEVLNELDIVVPNNTAGLIIGKGGETIKSLQQETGVRVKVSDKKDQDKHNLSERRVLLSGDLDRLKEVLMLLLKMIETDPMSGSVPTVTYGNSGPATVGYPTSHNTNKNNSSSINSTSAESSTRARHHQHHHSSRHSSSGAMGPVPPSYDNHAAAMATMTATPLPTHGPPPVLSWPGIPPATASIEFPVPVMIMESLLNHQPSAIPQIEGYSQASVYVRDSGSPKYKNVSISGTLSSAETAMSLLCQKIQHQSEVNSGLQ